MPDLPLQGNRLSAEPETTHRAAQLRDALRMGLTPIEPMRTPHVIKRHKEGRNEVLVRL